jgi:hypothetical protein
LELKDAPDQQDFLRMKGSKSYTIYIDTSELEWMAANICPKENHCTARTLEIMLITGRRREAVGCNTTLLNFALANTCWLGSRSLGTLGQKDPVLKSHGLG